jgi:8-hydroxy-5-deazaflavin:NADPH oxidoreductase
MKIAILGTGMVGQTLATALAAKGHEVMIGTRDVAASLANTQPNAYGMPSFGVWHKDHTDIAAATFADAAQWGDLLINASNGGMSLEVLHLAKLDTVGNKVLIDLANDLDVSKGMPPISRSSDVAGQGLAEQIQAQFPHLRVVKTLNTMTAHVMVNPAVVAGGDSTVFMSGNDADAKKTVHNILQSFGWTDIMDLGDISSSRAVEMLMPVWLRTWGVMGQTPFNFKIAR